MTKRKRGIARAVGIPKVRTPLSVAECTVPAPLAIYQDMAGEAHHSVEDARRANQRHVLERIVTHDSSSITTDYDEVVDFLLRNEIQLSCALCWSATMQESYEQHMNKKFGTGKWQAGLNEPPENRLIRAATWDAFCAGWFARGGHGA